jgi:N-acyl-D-aspartate/D-glutamate deacylase
MPKIFVYILLWVFVASASAQSINDIHQITSTLITYIQLIDGTGTTARNISVRIEGNKIIEVGKLTRFPGEKIIDGGGKILAPGFIDSHSHIAGSLKNHPDALADLSEGVTTIVSGQDGYSVNICSDGSYNGHPMGWGSFTRMLGYYVRERKIMDLAKAIQKMTSLSAEHTDIKNRGVIAPGYFADLVLFDANTVIDHANSKHANAPSTGIERVWVNGICVYENQQPTHQYPGMFLSR